MPAKCRLATLGPRIENDPAFPERINVNVATIVDDRLKLRTFERGAGETLACGTGACASGRCGNRVEARSIAGEGRHDRRQPDHRLGAGRSRSECAAAQPIVFSGELDLEALQ